MSLPVSRYSFCLLISGFAILLLSGMSQASGFVTCDATILDLNDGSVPHGGVNTLLAGLGDYNFTVKASDSSGIQDITYVMIVLDPNSPTSAAALWDRATGMFSQINGSNYAVLNRDASSVQIIGNQVVAKFKFSYTWIREDTVSEKPVRCRIAGGGGTATSTANSMFNVEHHLYIVNQTISAYHGSASAPLLFNGTAKYWGTEVSAPAGRAIQIKTGGATVGSSVTSNGGTYSIAVQAVSTYTTTNYLHTGSDVRDDLHPGSSRISTYTSEPAQPITTTTTTTATNIVVNGSITSTTTSTAVVTITSSSTQNIASQIDSAVGQPLSSAGENVTSAIKSSLESQSTDQRLITIGSVTIITIITSGYIYRTVTMNQRPSRKWRRNAARTGGREVKWKRENKEF